ncbi:hypothetical protein PI125_g2292 [Phytophthora idaei]|nr:hypothetical protein PI125_g2292 [Phytophthora idaei]KAG3168373.1 hypothetical protein PI126_g3285 [Phytophthora idaei]
MDTLFRVRSGRSSLIRARLPCTPCTSFLLATGHSSSNKSGVDGEINTLEEHGSRGDHHRLGILRCLQHVALRLQRFPASGAELRAVICQCVCTCRRRAHFPLLRASRIVTPAGVRHEMKLRMSTMMCERMTPNQSFSSMLSDDEEGVPVVTEPRYARRRPNEGHSVKIKKILTVVEAISVIVIAGQLYMAITNVSNSPVELSCANGMGCSTISTKWSLLHTLQAICVWILCGSSAVSRRKPSSCNREDPS